MERNPTFTVVAPTLNPGEGLEASLTSVLAQTRADFELIVIDDGSAEPFGHRLPADPRIRLIRHETNRGYGAATNTALAQARGDWIVFVDDDDTIAPDYLAQMEAVAHQHGADFVLAPIHTRLPSGRRSRLAWSPPGSVSTGAEAVVAVLAGKIVASQHLLMAREALVHPAPEDNAYSDFAFVVANLLNAATVAYTETGVYDYVIHDRSVTGTLRTSVWDLGRLPELIEPHLRAAFDEPAATAQLELARVLVLTQMLHKAAREPEATPLRSDVTQWCRRRIRRQELAASLRSRQPATAASLALAKASPALHRRAYQARQKRKVASS